MQLYADVSLPIPVNDGVLTYHVPESMGILQLGSRVLVNVVTRKLIGYVVRLHEETPSFKTLPVVEVLDSEPLISSTMFRLAERVSKDCVCAMGEILHCMLPAGIKQKIKKCVLCNKSDGSEALDWLIENPGVLFSSFVEKFGLSLSQIKKHIDSGDLEIIYSITEQQGPKFIKVLRPADDVEFLLDRMTIKERQVMEALMTFSSAPTASFLAKKANTSSAPINQLKKKGYIIEIEERVLRQVGREAYYKRDVVLPPELSSDQIRALEKIKHSFENEKKPVLIRGVTCSGKTEIYLRWVAEILNLGLTAIILVPEISLTPQMLKRFTDRFGEKVAVLHSKLSDGERFDQWERIRRGILPVVVGARSAVFAPLPKLGTIILDEEGEPSFKQGESPRYHAREVALARCEIEGAQLVMGSATPTVDSFENCLRNKYELVEINSRVSNRQPPRVKVVDMRNELVTKKNRSIFSEALCSSVKAALSNKKQVILFLNRRGFSSFVFCRECGESISCSQCKVSLVFHDKSRVMRCHYCGQLQNVPTLCPKCGSKSIKFFGAGTQRVEAEARRYFPGARIQRLDSDCVTTKGSLEDILDRFGNREIDILIGTQMVAKGLDFPDVTLVGILAADSLLRVPDFRASERNFSLLAQVSGRAGRGDCPGDVILQTYSPDHHSITYALTEDYAGFFKKECEFRKAAVFPPFIELAYFIISGSDPIKTEKSARDLLANITGFLKTNEQELSSKCEIFGPAPASIERINNRYRFQLMLKMSDLNLLTKAVGDSVRKTKRTGDIRVAVDINPFFVI
ncbi:primosomal protein N' [bacterium]|nr:primosomal protein N' [bacterium]